MSDDFASGLESVTSRIYKIRKKLNINAIQTVHRYGYHFEE
nr:helix-turn-helix domain-containing protein [Clostridium phoceensis]